MNLFFYLLCTCFFILPANASDNSVEIDYFKRAIQRDPNDLQAHLNYQKAVIESGNTPALKDEYRIHLQNHPQNAQYIYLYGRLLEKDSQKRVYFTRAINTDPALFQAQFDLGKLHYYAGEYNDAIVRYRIAAKLKPKSALVANLLGLAYYHSGHPDLAIVAYQKATKNDPTYADAYLNLGLAYYYTHQYDKTIQTYKSALKNAQWTNDKHLLYHSLGLAYRKQNHTEKATDAYREALRHNSNYDKAHVSLGNLAFEKQEYTKAIPAFQKALGTESEDANLHLLLGLSYFNTQNYPHAILHFQNTLNRDSTNIQTHQYLGRAYYLNNQPQEALNALEIFIAKEKRREKRPQVAEAKKLIFDIKKEQYTNILK